MKALMAVAGILLCLGCSRSSFAQEATEAPPDEAVDAAQAPPDPQNNQGANTQGTNDQGANSGKSEPTLENTIAAGESDAEQKQRQLVKWNEYHGPYATVRVGAGFLVDLAGYEQDQESKEQFDLATQGKIRDFRLLMNGRILPKSKRKITWCLGLMYDGPTNSWLLRQTGVMIAVPKLWGNLFVGRAKEGFSLNKVMTGYDGWTMERSTMNDATIPLLADGIKWLGYSPKHGFAWNLGYFNDVFSKGQSFSSYSSQEVARLIWLPQHTESGKLFHLGLNLRYGKVAENQLRLKSRPESFTAPYFIDTGTFGAKSSRTIGPEIYYRRGPWLFGTEYWWQHVNAPIKGDPLFHGGDVVVTWLLTGETRAYNTIGSYFLDIEPKRPVFNGGPGAWELVMRLSYSDFNTRLVRGGEFTRATPQVNWYLSDRVRLEFNYGYGHLNRFNLHGNTQFFQSRIQLQF
jgi:phosphate-selective porin OprO and OprP